MGKLLGKYKSMSIQTKASLWFVVSGFIQRGISLITTPIFTRILTPAEYGVFSVYNTWLSLITIIATLNLASGVYLRGLIKYEDDERAFSGSLQSLYVINTLAVFLIFTIFRKPLSGIVDLPFSYVCLMFIDILLLTSCQFWSAKQRVNFSYKKLVTLTLINAALNPSVGIIAVYFSKNKILARIVAVVVVDFITYGFLFVKMFFNKEFLNKKYWLYALNYNLPLIPHYLSQMVLNQSDRIMINNIVGESEAGIYSLAYSAALLLTIVNQSILNSYNPWMYKSIKDNKLDKIGSVSVTMLLIVASLNLALILFAPECIRILAPIEYQSAIWVIPPVSMSVYFMFLYSLFANFEFYFEKTKVMMVASVSGAALNVILNSIFIKKYGFLAAGYTTLVCYVAYSVFHYIVMKIILRNNMKGYNPYNIQVIAGISLSFCIIGFIVMALYNHLIIRYSLIIIVLILIFINRKKLVSTLNKIMSLNRQ